MTSLPCKETEKRVKNFFTNRTGNRKKEEVEMKEAVRHAIGSEWCVEIKCRVCWNYIREAVVNEEIGCRAGYASYIVEKNILLVLFSKEILRFYRNPFPPRK